jgi:uncharacterized protein (TIGR02421 family)
MFDPVVVDVDRGLAEVSRHLDVLLDVTPVNAGEAWQSSVGAGHARDLALRYRDRRSDTDAARTHLDALPVDQIADPVLRRLLTAKRDELAGLADLVDARGTQAFLPISLELYGTADDELLALAEDLLGRLDPPDDDQPLVSPDAFAERSREEIELYRRQVPSFAGTVEISDDVPSLMVVQRRLLVGRDSWVPVPRQEALVHHEVGVHLLTAETGGVQPLVLLEQGLAAYEETQEALGVLAEHLVAGIDAERMRTLAGRVVAVRCLTDGGSFPDLFGALHHRWGIPERQAWTIAMRVVRGGGLTKDVVYLRGIVALVDHLAGGGELGPLLVGKLHLDHVDDVGELLDRELLVPATVRPHWLQVGDAPDRLADLVAGRAPVSSWPA